LAQHDCAEPLASSRGDRAVLIVKLHDALGDDLVTEARSNFVQRQRGGEKYATLRPTVVELRNDEIWRGGQRLRAGQFSATPISHEIAGRGTAATLRDAIGICERDERADGCHVVRGRGAGAHLPGEAI